MTLKRAFWILGLVGLVPLVAGLYVRFTTHPDPTNLGSVVPWGLWIAQYVWLAGVAAGAYVISSLVYVFGVRRFEPIGRLAVFTSIVALPLGLLTVLIDLGHPERAWNVVAFTNIRSPMAWMIWLYGAFLLVVIVEFWFLMRRDLAAAISLPGWRGRVAAVLALRSRATSEASRAADMNKVGVLARIGLPLAILFPIGVGTLFGVLSARPFWYTGLFPVVFAVTALASGVAILALASTIFQEGWRAQRSLIVDLGRILLGLLILEPVLLASELGVGIYGNDRGFAASVDLVLSGPYWWVFWVGQVAIGLVVPIVILASRLGRDPRFVSAAAVAALVGFAAFRLNIVIPGLSPEEIAGITRAVDDPRITSDYFPSLLEWTLAVGIAGLGLVLFGLGEIFLPLSRRTPAGDPRA